MTRRARLAGVALAVAALAPAARAQTAAPVHGADAVFTGHGVVILWGVLRGPDEARSLVVIRVVARDPSIGALAVEGVDPFTGARITRAAPSPLGAAREIRIPRAAFADHPRTELHVAPVVQDLTARRAALTIYFTGVPDTTPELATEAGLASYLDDALARARAQGK